MHEMQREGCSLSPLQTEGRRVNVESNRWTGASFGRHQVESRDELSGGMQRDLQSEPGLGQVVTRPAGSDRPGHSSLTRRFATPILRTLPQLCPAAKTHYVLKLPGDRRKTFAGWDLPAKAVRLGR